MAKPIYTEVFIDDGFLGIKEGGWGFQCYRCGFEETGVTDAATAQEHADTHVCSTEATS